MLLYAVESENSETYFTSRSPVRSAEASSDTGIETLELVALVAHGVHLIETHRQQILHSLTLADELLEKFQVRTALSVSFGDRLDFYQKDIASLASCV
jgi:hypothetical protein